MSALGAHERPRVPEGARGVGQAAATPHAAGQAAAGRFSGAEHGTHTPTALLCTQSKQPGLAGARACEDCGAAQTWERRRRQRCEDCQKQDERLRHQQRYQSDPEYRAMFIDAAVRRQNRKRANGGPGVNRSEVLKRDGYRCRMCGVLTRDDVPRGHPRKSILGHIVAIAAGGEDSPENTCCLCHACNVADGVNGEPIQMHLGVA